jgi:hydroxymethylpyrimidine pyrophosphatase-like HAD family hydrolase
MDSPELKRSKRIITERNLIAADIDKTLLDQETGYEQERFFMKLGPLLNEAASNGTNIAVLTGNSMRELSKRFLWYLIKVLCHTNHLHTLEKFHFFCNAGGVYAHFPSSDPKLSRMIASQHELTNYPDQVFKELVNNSEDASNLSIKPRFINQEFLERNRIRTEDVKGINNILKKVLNEYKNDINKHQTSLSKKYNMELVKEAGKLNYPTADERTIEYGPEEDRKQGVVQITIRPLLSFRHAKSSKKAFNNDIRSKYTKIIQERLDNEGYVQYVARPGGRSSIDITLEKLDKASALAFLIEFLNLQGNRRLGGNLGSNTVYIGDEVIVGGGNDYPVTKIPGLLVLAVNEEKQFVPFLHRVFVPTTDLSGPDAAAYIISKYNNIACRLLNQNQDNNGNSNLTKTALEKLKEELFLNRIREKINNLQVENVDELQIIHAFVTLMCRKDPVAKKWLSLLVDELDGIMSQISSSSDAYQAALGCSYDEHR